MRFLSLALGLTLGLPALVRADDAPNDKTLGARPPDSSRA